MLIVIAKIIIKKVLAICNPEWEYWRKAKSIYKQRTGQKLRYSHPVNLNEKLMWLTRYWRHPLKTLCADKYEVRSFLADRGLDYLAVPLLGVYDDVNDLDFAKLPNKFVLKCNHGSSYNIIVNNKCDIDEDKIRNLLSAWMAQDYSDIACELHYKNIHHKIICEKLLSESAPMEYQFWCINGFPESILVCRKNFDGSYEAWSYSTEWERLYDRIGEDLLLTEVEKPIGLVKMIDYAKILSNPFPFVRVDFYECEGIVYFAELTFTPCANTLINYKQSFIERLGKKLILPKPYIR